MLTSHVALEMTLVKNFSCSLLFYDNACRDDIDTMLGNRIILGYNRVESETLLNLSFFGNEKLISDPKRMLQFRLISDLNGLIFPNIRVISLGNLFCFGMFLICLSLFYWQCFNLGLFHFRYCVGFTSL